jgi:hypothetical protein
MERRMSKNQEKKFRDGVSQSQRLLKQLKPGYISVDERSLSDLLKFLQKYAKNINYYNKFNILDGDWSAFFKSKDTKEENDKYIREMVAYIEKPDRAKESKVIEFSQPHLVLMFAFLKLLEHPQRQFKELTLRYLDFYYKEVLQLISSKEVPDQVNLIFKLIPQVEEHRLKKGTLLNATTNDEEANIDIQYEIDRDIHVNQAQITSIKTLFYQNPDEYGYENIYSNNIIDINEEEEEESNFQIEESFATLGTNNNNSSTIIGFAVTSNLLYLPEGERTITLVLFAKAETLNKDKINTLLNHEIEPFDIYLSNKTDWTKLESQSFTWGISNQIVGQPIKSYENTEIILGINDQIVILINDDSFIEEDVNQILVFDSEKIFRITHVSTINPQIAKVKRIPELETVEKNLGNGKINLYSDSAINNNNLKFQLNLRSNSNPVVPFDEDSMPESDLPQNKINHPIIKILLRENSKRSILEEIWDNISARTSEDSKIKVIKYLSYKEFKSIQLEQVYIKVEVNNLQDLKIRNDSSILDRKAAFELFGNYPKVGSGFYFSNQEINQKHLDAFSLELEWIGLPNDFNEHYQAYNQTLKTEFNNQSFQVRWKLFDEKNKGIDVGESSCLFQERGKVLNERGKVLNEKTILEYHNLTIQNYISDIFVADTEDPFKYNTYFKLELEKPDFGHDLYPIVLNEISLSNLQNIFNKSSSNGGGELPLVNLPYTPKVKSIYLNYTSSIEIDLSKYSEEEGKILKKEENNRIFQIHPFGYYVDIKDSSDYTDEKNSGLENSDNLKSNKNSSYLFPQYDYEGRLYIGINNLKPPQDVSFLFQITPGSGLKDIEAPDISWSYLDGNCWKKFEENEILYDTTGKLLNTGIIQLSIPKTTGDHQILSSDLYWLRVIAIENVLAIPETLYVRTQAVSATFLNQENSKQHFQQPLPANSIEEFVIPEPNIKAIEQPATSYGGKAAESDEDFITRVSERLRHKQRAITAWDYERLVLQEFPEVYKVKCITAINNIDPSSPDVTIVIISDISKTTPLSEDPKAPLHFLQKIKIFLEKRASTFVKINVKNPEYKTVTCVFEVVFSVDTSQYGEYINKLNEELRKFFAPWAYDNTVDIPLGRYIEESLVINFISQREYVDYLANFRFKEEINMRPDWILISADEHEITEVSEPDNYGIGYMKIGDNFTIK